MNRSSIILVYAITMCAAAQSLGAIRAMRTYTETTPDGKHLLVMISPNPDPEDGYPLTPEEVADIRRIRETYPKSGLYRNDGSTEPIWTTGFAWYTEMSSDGRYAASTSPGYGYGPHVTLFREGKVLRSYDMKDLVDTGSMLWWKVHGDWPTPEPELNASEMTYRYATAYGPSYVFDLHTGETIESHRPVQAVAVVLSVIVFGVIALVAFRLMRLRNAAAH